MKRILVSLLAIVHLSSWAQSKSEINEISVGLIAISSGEYRIDLNNGFTKSDHLSPCVDFGTDYSFHVGFYDLFTNSIGMYHGLFLNKQKTFDSYVLFTQSFQEKETILGLGVEYNLGIHKVHILPFLEATCSLEKKYSINIGLAIFPYKKIWDREKKKHTES